MSLAHHQLPPPAFATARRALVRLGYSERAVLPEYRFLDATGSTVRTNGLAFADPVRRTLGEYAACTIHSIGPGAGDGLEGARGIVEVLARTCAPFHLLHRGRDGDEKFALWTASPAGSHGAVTETRLIDSSIAPMRLDEVLARYSADLAPSRVADVKQGRARFTSEVFEHIRPDRWTQLSLILEDVNGPVLRDRFAQAVAVLRDTQARSGAWSESLTTQLAVQLLGALVLADTGGLDDTADGSTRLHRQDLNVRQLFARGAARYPHYFPPIPEEAEGALENAYVLLGDLSYAVFEPQMLVTLYRAAYTPEQRKRLGRFDTPMYLTRRILDQVPLELLRPEERCVCDMSAGWGSFLIAGHDRMARLADMSGRRLVTHLRGNDKDLSASQLARFGLLLSTQTDSWRVDTEDALEWEWLNTHRPSVIVGNPPFGGNRKQLGAHVRRRAHEQEANLFVRRAVDRLAPGGLLAMIVPRSFLASDSASEARQALLGMCDLQEVWDLPRDVFRPDATVETTVLFARRHSSRRTTYAAVAVGASHGAKSSETSTGASGSPELSMHQSVHPVVARVVHPAAMERFKRDGEFSQTQVQPTQATWNAQSKRGKGNKALTTHIMDLRLVLSDRTWRSIQERCATLGLRATVIQGAIIGNPQRKRRPAHNEPSTRVPWLPRAQYAVPRRFAVNYDEATSKLYPGDFEWPRWKDRAILAGPKVLIASINTPSWGQRVTPAIERRGYFVSDNFWIVVPTVEGRLANYNLEVTAAVIGWLVGNAWVVEHLRSPKISARALRSLPVPPAFSAGDRDALTDAVHALEAAALSGAPDPIGPIATIDAVLRAAYGLDDATYDRLRGVVTPRDTSNLTSAPAQNTSATWEVSGVVTAVNGADAESLRLTLAIPGFDGPQTVLYGPNMPGWLLRTGTLFQTTVTPKARAQGRVTDASEFGSFTVGPFAYMDETEVYDALADVLGNRNTQQNDTSTVEAT